MHTAILITFLIYFIILLLFGIIAYRQTHNLSDYVLGGRKLGVLVAGLSTGASGMSAWLLLGLPGDFYNHGLNRIWLIVCLIMGTYLNWFLIAKRLRLYTEKLNNSITVPEFLHNRFQDKTGLLRIISSLTIILFFTFYISMGLVSGAMLFESSFWFQLYPCFMDQCFRYYYLYRSRRLSSSQLDRCVARFFNVIGHDYRTYRDYL